MKENEDTLAAIYGILEIISKKWVLLIMHVISERRTTRFSDICDRLPEINPKILSDRLSELEAEGLIFRKVEQAKPVVIKYQLTPKAKDLIRVFRPLHRWAHHWRAKKCPGKCGCYGR